MRARALFPLVLALLSTILAAPHAKASGPHVFVVNSIADTGDVTPEGICGTCTLREAIQEANANTNPLESDIIAFGIAGAGPHVIALSSALPAVSEPVVIDGYTEASAVPNSASSGTNAVLQVVIDGTGTTSVSGLVVSGPGSIIKGLVVQNFDLAGIDVQADNTRIEGNFIGTNAAGTLAQGNGTTGCCAGVNISGNDLTIGGTELADRNLISANTNGVTIASSGPTGYVFQNNLIGTKADGTSSLPNTLNGVLLRLAPGNNHASVGGGSAPNVIAFSGQDGVLLINNGFGVSIQGNSIFGNTESGIDLNDNGPTANDNKDKDGKTDPNNLQNFPVLTDATSGASTAVVGSLSSTPKRKFVIEFFRNPAGTDQGKTSIGTITVKTNDKGKKSFTASALQASVAGEAITATATDLKTGDTSEFSAPVVA